MTLITAQSMLPLANLALDRCSDQDQAPSAVVGQPMGETDLQYTLCQIFYKSLVGFTQMEPFHHQYEMQKTALGLPM